ncbi:MAG: histidine phosphatase family protein [Patescibacteria group bacterium]|jgi:broad specificity phosphatase PhoE
MKTIVYLVRHGRVENPDKIEYGRLPGFNLSQLGREQAAAIGQEILKAKIDICSIVSSPLERAVQTSEIISQAIGVPFKTDERLTEWDQGPWEGKTTKEFASQSGYYNVPMKMEGLEPHEEAAVRVLAVVKELVDICAGKIVLIVSHRESMVSAVLKLQGKDYSLIHDLDMPVASVWELVFEGDQFISAALKWDTPEMSKK